MISFRFLISGYLCASRKPSFHKTMLISVILFVLYGFCSDVVTDDIRPALLIHRIAVAQIPAASRPGHHRVKPEARDGNALLPSCKPATKPETGKQENRRRAAAASASSLPDQYPHVVHVYTLVIRGAAPGRRRNPVAMVPIERSGGLIISPRFSRCPCRSPDATPVVRRS